MQLQQYDATNDAPVYRSVVEIYEDEKLIEEYSVCALCGEPADPRMSAIFISDHGHIIRTAIHNHCLKQHEEDHHDA